MSKILKLLNIGENTSPTNRLPLVAGMMENRDLSKLISDTPNRYPLAFFVSKFWLATQATQDSSTTHHPKSTGVNRHKFMADLPAVYVRKTSQNSPYWVICGAVPDKTESDSEHPMTFHSVVLTQKLSGGYHA